MIKFAAKTRRLVILFGFLSDKLSLKNWSIRRCYPLSKIHHSTGLETNFVPANDDGDHTLSIRAIKSLICRWSINFDTFQTWSFVRAGRYLSVLQFVKQLVFFLKMFGVLTHERRQIIEILIVSCYAQRSHRSCVSVRREVFQIILHSFLPVFYRRKLCVKQLSIVWKLRERPWSFVHRGCVPHHIFLV